VKVLFDRETSKELSRESEASQELSKRRNILSIVKKDKGRKNCQE